MIFNEVMISKFEKRFKENELLSRYTNFRIGGPAKFLVEVKSIDELKFAIEKTEEFKIAYFVLGGGSNTLVSDEGFNGLVIRLNLRNVEINGQEVIAEAGALSVAVARQTAKAGLAGFTWAISLPGTMGGAVRGNAGCFGGEMKDNVTKVEVLRAGEIVTLTNAELNFGYRESAIKHSDDIVLRVYLELTPGDTAALEQELIDIVNERKEKQPLYAGSAGCIFKNFEFTDPEEIDDLLKKVSVPENMLNARRISAGWIIDKLDLRGRQVGQAKISEEHANFIVNLGGATASDIVQLIAIVKHEARNRFGIQLQEEIKYLGF
jgi:UDP-N-acetylmuramate dehydrogenase